jgi:heterodisulfide reductase subunit C2
MTMKIKKQKESGLIRAVEGISGVNLNSCYQCKKCTSGCPVSRVTQSHPSEIVRRLQLGAGNELLDSEIVWMCLSCGTCYARCPMGINMAAVMDALRTLASERGASKPKGDMPLFNRKFLGTVKAYGRTYDLSMIMGYKLGTFDIFKDAEKFPAMLKRGKMAILPPSGANKQTTKKIFERAARNKGAGK